MDVVYMLIINNDETEWSDEIYRIHKTFQGALKSKQEIVKNWIDNEFDFTDSELKITKIELND